MTGQAGTCNPFPFSTFVRMIDHLDFDLMLEGKAKDLELLRLRSDVLRYAPHLASRLRNGSASAGFELGLQALGRVSI